MIEVMAMIIGFLGSPTGSGLFGLALSVLLGIFGLYFYFRPRFLEAKNRSLDLFLREKEFQEKNKKELIDAYRKLWTENTEQIIALAQMPNAVIESLATFSTNKPYLDVATNKWETLTTSPPIDKEKIDANVALSLIIELRKSFHLAELNNELLMIIIFGAREQKNRAKMQNIQASFHNQ